jgi:hypothetical protein
MIVVELSWFEVEMAAIVGVRRRVEAEFREGRHDLYATPDEVEPSSNWQTQIEGAIGELAFAKALGRNWNGSINTYRRGGDVGAVQVRTRSRHSYELNVRTHDRDEDYFVLLTGQAPKLCLRGWIRGADAKRADWLKDHGGHGAAYFVPHSELHSFGDRGVTCASSSS